MTAKRKDKRERKMTPEELQQFLYFRKRGYIQKDRKKSIPRKLKHKEVI